MWLHAARALLCSYGAASGHVGPKSFPSVAPRRLRFGHSSTNNRNGGQYGYYQFAGLFPSYSFTPQLTSLYNNKPVYRLQQQSIRRRAFVPPYSVFCSISFRCGGLSIERNQKPLTPENTLTVTHHDKQKQVEVKRSSRANPHEIRIIFGCPYYFTLPRANHSSFIISHSAVLPH